MRTRILPLLAVAFVLPLAACGGDDDEPEQKGGGTATGEEVGAARELTPAPEEESGDTPPDEGSGDLPAPSPPEDEEPVMGTNLDAEPEDCGTVKSPVKGFKGEPLPVEATDISCEEAKALVLQTLRGELDREKWLCAAGSLSCATKDGQQFRVPGS